MAAAWLLSGNNAVTAGVSLTNSGALDNSGSLSNAGTLTDSALLINTGTINVANCAALQVLSGSYLRNDINGAIARVDGAVSGFNPVVVGE